MYQRLIKEELITKNPETLRPQRTSPTNLTDFRISSIVVITADKSLRIYAALFSKPNPRVCMVALLKTWHIEPHAAKLIFKIRATTTSAKQ